MVSVQLLLENDNWFAPEPKQVLQSMEQNYGNIILESCLQREGTKNAMGRIYPYEILKREFDVYESYVAERSAHMECDHPQSVVITLANSCSIVSKQWWVKNERMGRKEWWGNIEVYPAFKGADVQKLVQSRIKFGVSSRGVGSTEKSMQQEADVVQNDFTIITFDIVSHPSTHFAIPRLKVDRTLTTESAVGIVGNDIYNRITQNKINMFLANRNKVTTN